MVKNNNREGNKMLRKFLKEAAFTTFLLIFLLSPSLLFAFTNDDIYDAAGFDPHRQTLSSMPDENIDPFTGGLTLNHVDMRLPGNGGLDLVIQRTFNSKSVCTGWICVGSTCSCSKGENTWLGYGWALHFGRLFKSSNVNIHHFVEMPDGSRHTAYLKSGSSFITKDYSLLDLNSVYVLTLTNGTKIYYGQSGPSLPNYPQHSVYYATKIQDVNGNTINIYYKSPGNMVSYIMDSVGRRIDFNTSTINGVARLTSISGPGVSVTYTHQTLTTLYDTILTRANLPVGNPWEYTYKNLELQSVKSPYGGIITYAYGFSNVNACGTTFTYRTVVQKNAGGSNISPGTWNISYSQGTGGEYTQISDPCGRTIKYSYYGYGSSLAGGSMWKLGLPKSKEVVGEETTTYTWINSASISTDDYVAPYCGRDSYTYVPFIAFQAITRGGKTYTTAYSNYDGYGNPKTLSETGDTTRTKNLTYWYNTSNNIVQNKPSSEAVSGGFPGAFSTNFTYNGNGNLTQLNKYGVVTNHSYYTNGNLYSTTDANGNTTSYQWTNGKISKITNPIYSISRSINSNGTVASETNGRGYTMSFTYDGNLRPTKIQPPLGNPTSFTYPADNSYKYESRGNYYTYYYYDGFGRPSGTYDSKGVDTDIVYKSCGPKNYTTSNIGDTSYYDNFGRVTQLVHKDNSKITYSYSGSNVTAADEAAKVTTLTYNAFGDPDEKFLISVKDPAGSTTSYIRNILGSLTKITQGSVIKSYTYNGKNFLTSETHPESGTINYTRDNVGNMTIKADALGTKNYSYDRLHRLTKVQYGADTVYLDYDNADNRIGLTTTAADIDYTYDSANRLTQKTAVIASRTYTTRYDYDNNDNITQQYYPTGTWITYDYNGNNQVTYITGFGGNVPSVTYNTAGLPTAYTFSNGITTNNTYNSRNLTTTITAGNAFNYGYSYDSRGNTTVITNNLIDTYPYTYTYDDLSRLTGFNGIWGTGSFTYDTLGNRLNKKIVSTSTSYSYTGNRLSSTSGGEPATYSYNGYGSLTGMTKSGITYSLIYDTLNNLKSYKSGSTTLAAFSYDGDGMRATKTAGGKIVVYHYDKDGRVISETDSAGNLISDYIYLNGKLVAKKAPSAVYFYHTDPAGTPMAMTNMSRDVMWSADYKPFGEESWISGTLENNEKFVGKEKDKETGLYYFGARYMKAEIGRFTSPDPVGPVDPRTGKTNDKVLINPQRLNVYAYGLNNPYKYVDPLGLFEITIVEAGERNRPTYGAKIKVIGENGKFTEVRGSTWPNPNNPSPGIAEGPYDATYSTTGHKGITNGIRLEDGGEIPTLGPNPAQGNQEYATGINIHSGYSNTNRGSAGCITIDPKQAYKVWSVLQNGETGTVTIDREPKAKE
jgi:RHS repeat-associated protein